METSTGIKEIQKGMEVSTDSHIILPAEYKKNKDPGEQNTNAPLPIFDLLHSHHIKK
jgi:hypothetical protein